MFTTSLAKATECYWSISEILADCPPTLAGLGQLVRCRKQLLGPSPQRVGYETALWNFVALQGLQRNVSYEIKLELKHLAE